MATTDGPVPESVTTGMGGRPGFRVYVDGSYHPVHDDASGVRAALVYATGEVAEVQIAKVGADLVVVLAGAVDGPRTGQGGHQVLVVSPTAKVPR